MALSLGWFNVDAMLDTAPAGQLAEWWEYYQLQPWGDDWERTSLEAATVFNTLNQIACGFAKTSPGDPLPRDAFVPFRNAKAAQTEWSAEKLLAVMRAQIGV